MFDRIKNIFSGLGYALKYGDVIRSVTTAWSRFPGLDDSEALRIWLRPLLTDAADFKRLEGKTALNFAVQTVGQSQRQMVGNLGGKGEVKFTNGAIKGVNIAQLIRNVGQGALTGWDHSIFIFTKPEVLCALGMWRAPKAVRAGTSAAIRESMKSEFS